MILVGIVWLLQGIGILPGSFMTGQVFWAIAGGIVLILGVASVFAAFRLDRRR